MPGRKEPEAVRREAILRAALAVAIRDHLAGVTARGVAREAGISPGLLFFHFGTVDNLLLELLDWLLARTIVAGAHDIDVAIADPVARILTIIRRDLEGLPRQRERIELFFEYWIVGARDAAIRRKIRRALGRYRATYRALGEALATADPVRYSGTTPDALADVVVNFVEGCALQVVTEPRRFRPEQAMQTLTRLVGQPTERSAHTSILKLSS